MTNLISNHYCMSSTQFSQLLHAIKNLENPDLLTPINELEALEPKSFYQRDVLSVLKWFNDYYMNCIGYGEQEFIGQYIHKIIDSPYPKRVLDTLCLLYYYNLYKSQDQLNNEFIQLKNFLEKKQSPAHPHTSSQENRHFIGRTPQMSIEPYMDIILEHKHCKKIANILAIMNKHGFLNQNEVSYLFKQPYLDFELLEKSLIKLNNKFLIKNNFLLTPFIRETYHSIFRKLKQATHILHSKTTKNIFLILDHYSCLTIKSIILVLNTRLKEKKSLLEKLSILTKENNCLTKEVIDQFLTTFYSFNTNSLLKNNLISRNNPLYSFDQKNNASQNLLSSEPSQLPTHHKSLDRASKPRLFLKKNVIDLLTKTISRLINAWKQYLVRHKNKKMNAHYYQLILKKLSQTTDIKSFASLLCDMGLFCRKTGYLPPKKSQIHSVIEHLITSLTENSQQIDVLNWLNSNAYRYGCLEEQTFIQQHLDKIFDFTSPKDALHVLWMFYYCGFHTEKRLHAILESDQANHFIALFLEKLSCFQGKSVDLLKKEVEVDLDRMNALSKALHSDSRKSEKLSASQSDVTNNASKPMKPICFFPLNSLCRNDFSKNTESTNHFSHQLTL